MGGLSSQPSGLTSRLVRETSRGRPSPRAWTLPGPRIVARGQEVAVVLQRSRALAHLVVDRARRRCCSGARRSGVHVRELVRLARDRLLHELIGPLGIREDDVDPARRVPADVRAEHDGVRRVSAERGRVRRRRQQFDVPAAAVELLLVLGAELKHERLAFVRDRLAHVRAEGVRSARPRRFECLCPRPRRRTTSRASARSRRPGLRRSSTRTSSIGRASRLRVDGEEGAGGRRRRRRRRRRRSGRDRERAGSDRGGRDGWRADVARSSDRFIDSNDRSRFEATCRDSKKLERRRRERRARDAPSNRSSKYTSAETTEAIAARNARTVASLNMSRSAGEGSGRRARRSDGALTRRDSDRTLISETGGTRRTSISSTKKARAPPARRHKPSRAMEVADFALQAREGVREGLHPSHPQVHEAGQEGVQQGGASNGDGVHRDGVRRVLREAHLVRRRPRAISVLHFLFLSLFIGRRRRRRPSRVASRLRSSSCAAIARARAEEGGARWTDRPTDRSRARGASPRSSRLIIPRVVSPSRAFAPRSTVRATDVPALVRSSRSIPINNIILAA